MICFFCHRPIRGADLEGRYEWRRQPDGTVLTFGPEGDGGKLKDARGQLVRLSHGKCYHASRRREELQAARAADAGDHQPAEETDWRHQESVEVGDLEGNRADGGA